MKKYLLIFVLSLIAIPAYAANTSGSAWSESVGWFNFSNATVSSSNITGQAYNDNTGWLVLDGITNSAGTLSGYAWSESVGYFDFSDVVISSGAFSGQAYNDNTGWLSFGAGTNVTTTWRRGGGGSTPACVYTDPVWSTCVNSKQTRTLTAINQYCVGEDPKIEEQACIMPVATTTATTTATTSTTTVPVVNSTDCNFITLLQTLQNITPTQATIARTTFNCSIEVNLSTTTNSIIIQLANNPRDLQLLMIGEDVKLLQQFLNQQGYVINPNPGQPGSPGFETTKFGAFTKQALIRFQIANKITPASGYFGPKTRAFIKTLLTN